ncbi:hypothetical protein ScPMuIL_005480 [Solemya velum]
MAASNILKIIVGFFGTFGTIYFSKTSFQAPVLKPSYDYIIVGAGSAGAVLANRLSADSSVSVLLLEAGGVQLKNPIFEIPYIAYATQHTSADWEYYYEEQVEATLGQINQRAYLPRGKVLGGTSMLNYNLYSRGSRFDYDGWESDGNTGWSYDNILPYFLRSEKINVEELEDSDYHSTDGEWSVSEMTYTPLMDYFFEAAQELSLPIIDCNGPQLEGACKNYATIKNGRRHSTFGAFIEPIRHRRNLDISLQSLATKILIEDDRATGVEFRRKGRSQTVMAAHEVIVSGGAINSPQLLMLSGIGPQAHLQQMNIPVIKDLPVGNNLQDHLMTMLSSCINTTGLTINNNEVFGPRSLLQYKLKKEGYLTSSGGLEATMNIQTNVANEGITSPDVYIGLLSLSVPVDEMVKTGILEEQLLREYFACPGENFVLNLVLLQPKSKGTVRLASSDPLDDPLIDPQLLTDSEDISTLIKGIRFALNDILGTEAFRSLDATKPFPISVCNDHTYDSDEYWECFIRHVAYPIYHPTSTVKMGPSGDPESVVDSELRVHGIVGLRVVDTSIMPNIIAGNPSAPAAMIAEKVSDMILGKPPLERK